MPDFTANVGSGSSTGDMKYHLQNLLDSKEKQLQQAGTLGQRVLAQQMELEERIRQLQEADMDKGDDEELDTEATAKYRELAETIRAWDAENAQLSSAFGNKRSRAPSLANEPIELPREEPERNKAAGSSAAQSRRAKNAAHRADDVALTAADTHKNDSERVKGALEELKIKHETDFAQARKAAAVLQRDKADLQQTLDRTKADLARAAKHPLRFGSPSTPNGDVDRDYLTPAGTEQDEDVFTGTHGASTNRRKMDSLFPDFGEGLDEYGDLSPDPSPSKPFLAPSHPNNEMEALQQRLAHAQRTINTLKGTLRREKELRMDYRKKLEASPGFDAADLEESEEPEKDLEGDYEDVDDDERPKRKVTPYRVGHGRGRGQGGRGRGRGRGGLTLAERFGRALHSPASEYGSYDQDDLTASPLPPVPAVPARFQDEEDEDSTPQVPEEEDFEESNNVLEPPSNRVSVDGMDPAFANILRKPAPTALPHGSSPLRQSITARGARTRSVRGGGPRKSRGGHAYQDSRPSSLVGQPEALAAELGLGMMAGAEVDHLLHSPDAEGPIYGEPVTEKEYLDFECQTEFPELPLPTPPIHVTPAMSDMAVQADFVPEPILNPTPIPVLVPTATSPQVVVPRAETSEMSCQTDEEPVVVPPIFISSSVNTDAEVTPIRIDAGAQTPTIKSSEIDIQTVDEVAESDESGIAYDNITSRDWSHADTADNTITRSMGRAFLAASLDDEDDGEVTETGAETEPATDTDGEGYTDARQSVFGTTPSGSRDDFHSVMTMSDNDFSSDDDDSLRIAHQPYSIASGQGVQVLTPVVVYEEKGISAEAPEPAPRVEIVREVVREVVTEVVHVEAPKPEVKETSIQTDEWNPPLPVSVVAAANALPVPVPVQAITPSAASTSLPPSPGGFGLYKAGSTGQQFQYVSPPPSGGPTSASLPVSAPSPVVPRDSGATFGSLSRSRTSYSDRRQSIESAISSKDDTPRSRAQSGPLTVDRSRPPMMALPPPPRQPPPSNSMQPPAFIPERKQMDMPPPRPLSPPPAELIQRATTPLGSVLTVPGGRPSYLGRQHGSSMPPSQQGLRQLPSTSSFRSAANAAAYAQALTHSDRSIASPRSSISSDHQLFAPRTQTAGTTPATPGRDLESEQSMQGPAGASTDPTVIHAITQTMIGEFLYKYTRRAIGKGHGERRHKRFFWVHPYTKTLYWSSADPGSSNVSESSAKSAYIEGVRSVLDPNPMPPGLYQYSVVVTTAQREMKITAPTKERHDIWLNALKYLLSRPNTVAAAPGDTTVMPTSPISGANGDFGAMDRPPVTPSPKSQRSVRSTRNELAWNTTPRGQHSRTNVSVVGSVGKRSGTPAAEYLRYGPESPYSPGRSFEHVPSGSGEGDLDFELNGGGMSDDGFEGLENVRACCDGRHTVGHHHHHLHNHDHPQNGDSHLDVRQPDPPRPASPAWSFRSRSGSTHSHEGNSLFGGKLRFGSRRSTKTTLSATTAGAHDR
ncbi:hypothetical protein HWV62_9715 [Athelia sp. TMB]|nr:hypothetical protein HWV62_9715 [Athelia sp. TMB]